MSEVAGVVPFGEASEDALLALARGGDGDAFGQLVEARLERTLPSGGQPRTGRR
jgi:hypothetical protein